MLPSFAPVVPLKVSATLRGAKQRFNKERFQLAENSRSARCSPFVISKVLAARMRKLITARARKNRGTARMLANARKDHWICNTYGWQKTIKTKEMTQNLRSSNDCRVTYNYARFHPETWRISG